MSSFNNIKEINVWETSLLSDLDSLSLQFSKEIEALFVQRKNIGKSISSLISLNTIKQLWCSEDVLHWIQEIKNKHPEIAWIYEAFADTLKPEVLDLNINKFRDGVFDEKGINNYLPIVDYIVKEYIQEIKWIIETTANIERVDFDKSIDYFEQASKKKALLELLIQKRDNLKQAWYGLTLPISTILLWEHHNDTENRLSEKGILSIMQTLQKYHPKEIESIKNILVS